MAAWLAHCLSRGMQRQPFLRAGLRRDPFSYDQKGTIFEGTHVLGQTYRNLRIGRGKDYLHDREFPRTCKFQSWMLYQMAWLAHWASVPRNDAATAAALPPTVHEPFSYDQKDSIFEGIHTLGQTYRSLRIGRDEGCLHGHGTRGLPAHDGTDTHWKRIANPCPYKQTPCNDMA